MMVGSLAGISSPWIKVCGLRDAAMGTAAVEAGANLLGCVLEPTSPRHLSLEHALELAQAWRHLPCAVVAVVVDLPDGHPLLTAWPGPVQIHGHASPVALATLRARGVDLILAGPDALQRSAVGPTGERFAVGAHLVDHASPGSGSAHDLAELQATISDRSAPVIIAGGLGPTNVAKTIKALRPEGVDASSRLESARGVKDGELVRAFASAARAAFG